MPAIFDILPGIEVPVGDVAKGLADLWANNAADGRPAPEAEDARATQVNFVLHFGFNTTPEDAREQFQVIERFSRRYPSRIVVLCPLAGESEGPEIRAKIYGECFLGKSKADKRCVEFVMLSYSRRARPYLESQVSICLSTDLPLYYWAHRFRESGRLADYRFLLGRSKRVLIDSSTAPADILVYPWPNPKGLRDLVYSRLLPIRQTIGQFLAVYPPASLVEGLRSVTLSHSAALAAEGRVALSWFGRRLAACGGKGAAISFQTAVLAADADRRLSVKFEYDIAGRHFRWQGDLKTGHALFEADFGSGPTKLAAAVSLLSPEMALSEAMFF